MPTIESLTSDRCINALGGETQSGLNIELIDTVYRLKAAAKSVTPTSPDVPRTSRLHLAYSYEIDVPAHVPGFFSAAWSSGRPSTHPMLRCAAAFGSDHALSISLVALQPDLRIRRF